MQNRSITNPWLALVGLSLVSFLGCIDFTIVNTALPVIQMNLDVSMTQLQWIINIFMLALSSSMVIAGRIADMFGRVLVLYIGMLIFATSSLGAGLAPNIDWLILFRLLQGVGVAILYTVPIAIISNLFLENQRGKATGILISVNGLGLAVGPVIGGFIVSLISWRWIFLVNLPIILLGLLCCIKTLRESKSIETGTKVDLPGFILLIIALPTLVLATVQGSAWGWTSITIISLYTIAITSFILFYFIENRTDSPIINFKLFANKMFIAGVVANFSLAFCYTVAFFFMPLYLQNIHYETSYKIGLILLPATAMLIILSPLVGHSVNTIGHKKTILIGFLLFAISTFMQTYFSSQTSVWFILLSLVFFGIGWAFILSPSIIAALSSLPENMSGVAMGSLGTLHNFGGAIGLAIGTVVYHYQAKLILLPEVIKDNLKVGNWLDKAIADPDNAVNVIHQNTSLSIENATALFQHFFIYGYHHVMELLFLISLFAFLMVFGIKKSEKNSKRRI